MKDKLIVAIIAINCLLLSACGLYHQQEPNVDTTNLNQLQTLVGRKVINGETGTDSGQIRFKALEDTALSLGAQGGLGYASKEINANLLKDKKHLETIFNFNGMMLTHGVLPPVLVQGDDSLNLDDPDTIRIADKTYKIVSQARFATTPPNWRDYLWQEFEKPEVPNKILLPETSEERRLWKRSIKIGWDKGIEQAYSIFQQNLARLKRDYQGMILYRKLLQERMISAPYVSKTELGVTGDGEVMRVNDQVLRITVHPQLQTESNGWKAIVVKPNDDTSPFH
jgi:defect-in-organelle-trafficking protein DotC